MKKLKSNPKSVLIIIGVGVVLFICFGFSIDFFANKIGNCESNKKIIYDLEYNKCLKEQKDCGSKYYQECNKIDTSDHSSCVTNARKTELQNCKNCVHETSSCSTEIILSGVCILLTCVYIIYIIYIIIKKYT